jgi:hypothetical protein
MLHPGDLSKLRAHSWADIGLFFRVFALLAFMRAAIVLVPLRWFLRALGMSPVRDCGPGLDASPSPDKLMEPGSDSPFPENLAQASKIAWALQAAAARTPWQSACLTQALAGSILLRRRGIPFTLNLGVTGDVASGIMAHAWLCCCGAIVTGSSGVERFHTISSFTILK